MNSLRKYIRELLKEANTFTMGGSKDANVQFSETDMVALKIAYRKRIYTSRDMLTELRAVEGVVTVNQVGSLGLLKKGIETMHVDIRFMTRDHPGPVVEKDAENLVKAIENIKGVYLVKALGFGEENRIEDIT